MRDYHKPQKKANWAGRKNRYVKCVHCGEHVEFGPVAQERIKEVMSRHCDAARTATKQVGGRIQVLADDVLGTPAAMATIRAVHDWGYTVHIDGDEPEWDGPVNFKGEVLCEMPG